ncbi:stage II sporulation protein D [Paenibacillus sp. IB182496]|uniref:Stage II sporulation protein D n=1 Tax=Paenibacillus sabuli TaxID=2772509 RepID=A0A927GRU3_9BACL|nr:stage II sporulation protein D [Paenibacillus sabuli]MBD2845868.1 stage II sporulation protein D [Paenibacillus sabuli]
MKLLGYQRLYWWMAFCAGMAAVLVLAFGLRDSESAVPLPDAIVQLPDAASGPGSPAAGSTSTPNAGLAEESREAAASALSSDVVEARSLLGGLRISVYLSETAQIERLPLELYVRGVLAGEMPAEFELEALKAQAIAARTYAIRYLRAHGAGAEAGGSDITDTVQHQVYVPLAELADAWPADKSAAYLRKLSQAVRETRGIIATYEGEPIEASFFSTSAGRTENAEDYWSAAIPYLRSVASPWDAAIAPRADAELELSAGELADKLGIRKKDLAKLRIAAHTAGGAVARVEAGDHTWSGREIRELLGLDSSHFTWRSSGQRWSIVTRGYGHGVGMSQWGANGMAREGYMAEQILAHYYTGIRLETLDTPSATNETAH